MWADLRINCLSCWRGRRLRLLIIFFSGSNGCSRLTCDFFSELHCYTSFQRFALHYLESSSWMNCWLMRNIYKYICECGFLSLRVFQIKLRYTVYRQCVHWQLAKFLWPSMSHDISQRYTASRGFSAVADLVEIALFYWYMSMDLMKHTWNNFLLYQMWQMTHRIHGTLLRIGLAVAHAAPDSIICVWQLIRRVCCGWTVTFLAKNDSNQFSLFQMYQEICVPALAIGLSC